MHNLIQSHAYRRRRPTIGVLAGWRVYTGTLDTFLGPVYQGTRSAAQDLECNLMLSCSVDLGIAQESPRPAWAVPLPDVDFIPVGPWNVDGLLIVGRFTSEPTAAYLRRLLDEHYPLVFVGAGEKGPTVMADNEGGIRQAMAHLVAHGHRRIAFIAGYQRDTDGDSARRIKAYYAAVAEYGLDDDPRLIAYGSHSTGGGRQAMEQILASGVTFTALVASNDLSAIGAMQVLNRAGLRIPHDVAVIGFDDRLEAAAHVPPLTTVHYPAFEEGYQGVALLLEYIEGRAEGIKVIQIPTQLIVRESCGCLIGAPIVAAVPSISGMMGEEPPLNRVVQMMMATLAIYLQQLNAEQVEKWCRQLVEAFILAVERQDGPVLYQTLRQISQQIAALGGELNAWQAAISLLRDNISTLIEIVVPETQRYAEDLLDRARLVIAEAVHEQNTRHLLRQISMADQIGRMTARFLAAHDEAEIFAILRQTLPTVGIQHAVVVFYAPENDDPVAWSVIQTPPLGEEAHHRFPSRQFPPPGLYPEECPFSLALLPLRIQDGASGFVAFESGNLEPCADIVRQLTTALRSLGLYRQAVAAQRLAEERRQIAEEANRLKSRFLSMVSHELRTPLNLISGLSDLLLHESEGGTGAENDSRREDLERIYINAQHLDGLIRDVLDLTRFEVGQLQLSCTVLDMLEVLSPVMVIGRQLAQDKGLAWRVEMPEQLPPVWGDRLRLRQVVLNLVNNAVKFTAQGEVRLRVSVADDTLTISVRDTGLGIPPEEQTLIFDEFRQSERTTARGYGGLGLGLAICKLLVNMHQGSIGVHSSGEEGQGSEFYFTLPVLKAPPLPEVAALTCSAALPEIWLFTADKVQGRLLQKHFVRQGVEVAMRLMATEEDWQALLHEKTPDVVILDQAVTAAGGWEILRTFKENPRTCNVPVLFYTLNHDEDTGTLLDIDLLVKPIKKALMTEVLRGQGLLEQPLSAVESRKILVVEDDLDTMAMHTRLVQAQLPDYQVLQARNGIEALQIIAQERLALVLLDLMMPELDGFGVLEAMRADPASRHIPVVVLTAQVLTEEDMARLNRGTVSILSKGLFNAQETLQRIEAVLSRRRKTASDMQRLVHKAMAFIHTHYMDSLTRAEIAAYVGLSERHLTRCFQQEMGMTPMTYLNRYRIKQAKTLLEAGELGITEIAMEVGFSSGGYFTRVFRQEMGVSPRAYQSTPSAAGKLSEKCKKPSEK